MKDQYKKTTVYYNEIEPSAILWLQAAINEGVIAYGHIDTRPIQEVEASDLKGYTQHHFFAGIGGWSIALRLAGWDDARPVWTGSCPCQSFSTAGQGKGKDDERHLWPMWKKLIEEFRPATIFGEQVAAAITHEWWDEVADDLEAQSYAAAQAVLPAISVGRYHRRERLWFVADKSESGLEERTSQEVRESGEKQRPERLCVLGNPKHNGQPTPTQQGSKREAICRSTKGKNCTSESTRTSDTVDVADTNRKRSQRKRENSDTQRREKPDMGSAGLCNGTGVQWIDCPDGKRRPVEPSIHMLAHGIPPKLRKAALHGYGNAIVPQVATEFIGAYMDTQKGGNKLWN